MGLWDKLVGLWDMNELSYTSTQPVENVWLRHWFVVYYMIGCHMPMTWSTSAWAGLRQL